ncbi:MAG: spore coat protein CotJB [Clostridia bacterium]|nr:spore coat protein CotJB [Clostridia bacterium]
MDDRMTLKHRIGAYTFAIWEMTLYLDTHPHETCALNKRRELMEARCQLIDEYEAQYGPFVRTSEDVKGDCWSWIDGPWPWEYGRGNN